MMKKILLLVVGLSLTSCDELKNIASQLPSVLEQQAVSNLDITSGLKAALSKGISDEVSKLTKDKGFYNNDLVRIALPADVLKIDAAMRKYGFGDLADKGLIALNATAEDAVKTATPIFVSAIKNMSFLDARDILMGKDNAATAYLTSTTNDKLYASFSPVIENSFDKVGAADIWSTIISKYNQIPFVTKINPDLTDYVTTQALTGVYKMVSIEEYKIRTDITERSSALLQKVFALQDKK